MFSIKASEKLHALCAPIFAFYFSLLWLEPCATQICSRLYVKKELHFRWRMVEIGDINSRYFKLYFLRLWFVLIKIMLKIFEELVCDTNRHFRAVPRKRKIL